MTVQERLYTADDLLSMSHGGGRYELVKGVLVEMTPSCDTHTELGIWLAYLLMGYIVPNDLGVVSGADGGYILFRDPDTVRSPDVGFIAKARLKPMKGKFYDMAPDLAVEIVSPNDTAKEVRAKVKEYFRAGVPLVWVIYPDDRSIDVHRPNQPPMSLEIGDVLDGGDVLSGFTLPVKDIFSRLRD